MGYFNAFGSEALGVRDHPGCDYEYDIGEDCWYEFDAKSGQGFKYEYEDIVKSGRLRFSPATVATLRGL